MSGPYSLDSLPFSADALEPVISQRTLDVHHGKHHRGYVDALNQLAVDQPWAGQPLADVVRLAAASERMIDVYRNAAQAWNHGFFWRSLAPGGGGTPPATMLPAIRTAFGSVDTLRRTLIETAMRQFGSGWAWLVARDGHLEVTGTANADTPLLDGAVPLLVIDVWEHAYYLDYQNRRADYVHAVIDRLLNWPLAAQRLEAERVVAGRRSHASVAHA